MSITEQLKAYANNKLSRKDMSLEAQLKNAEIFDDLNDGMLEDDEDAELFEWGSNDYKEWLATAFENGMYSEDNLEWVLEFTIDKSYLTRQDVYIYILIKEVKKHGQRDSSVIRRPSTWVRY